MESPFMYFIMCMCAIAFGLFIGYLSDPNKYINSSTQPEKETPNKKVDEDFTVVCMIVETDFFRVPLGEQKNFVEAVNKKIKEGYIPIGETKVTDGSSGGMFSNSQYPMLMQAFEKKKPKEVTA